MPEDAGGSVSEEDEEAPRCWARKLAMTLLLLLLLLPLLLVLLLPLLAFTTGGTATGT
jgi:hypothetical protein